MSKPELLIFTLAQLRRSQIAYMVTGSVVLMLIPYIIRRLNLN